MANTRALLSWVQVSIILVAVSFMSCHFGGSTEDFILGMCALALSLITIIIGALDYIYAQRLLGNNTRKYILWVKHTMTDLKYFVSIIEVGTIFVFLIANGFILIKNFII